MNVSAAATLFKALGDPTRVRLVRLLASRRVEICNCEFVDALLEPQPNISRHLAVLVRAGLVTERRDGRWTYYDLASTAPASALGATLAEVKDAQAQDDGRRLRTRLARRRGGRCVIGIQTTLRASASVPKPQPSQRRRRMIP
jgi:ArsR family transcriptional regulator, arsenate/arsenite/antimonite-responsive transcriptional repressor